MIAHAYKRAIGYIAHLRNQFISTNTFEQSYDYIIMLIRRENTHHLHFENWMVSICKTLSPLHPRMLWLKLDQWFWKRWKREEFTDGLTTGDQKSSIELWVQVSLKSIRSLISDWFKGCAWWLVWWWGEGEGRDLFLLYVNICMITSYIGGLFLYCHGALLWNHLEPYLCRSLWMSLHLSNKSPPLSVNPEYIHIAFSNKKYRTMSYTFKKNFVI